MTYEHYLEWQKYVASRIEDELARQTFEGGNNSAAFFDHVGVDVIPPPAEPEETRQPTWEYIIYGTIFTVELSQTFGPALAARIRRSTNVVGNDSVFVQSTEVLTIPDVSTRTKRVTYYVTTMEPAQLAQATNTGNFSNGIYRGGLKLTCEFYQGEVTGEETFVRNYTLFVRQNGDSVTLTPPDPNKTYYLRITSVERL